MPSQCTYDGALVGRSQNHLYVLRAGHRENDLHAIPGLSDQPPLVSEMLHAQVGSVVGSTKYYGKKGCWYTPEYLSTCRVWLWFSIHFHDRPNGHDFQQIRLARCSPH